MASAAAPQTPVGAPAVDEHQGDQYGWRVDGHPVRGLADRLDLGIQVARSGVVVVYGVPWLRRLPVDGAQWIASLGSERKELAPACTLSVFCIVPGLLTFVSLRFF